MTFIPFGGVKKKRGKQRNLLLPSPACFLHLSAASWWMLLERRRAPSCPLYLRLPRRCESSSSSSPFKITKVGPTTAAATEPRSMHHQSVTWSRASASRRLKAGGRVRVHVQRDQLCRCELFFLFFPCFFKNNQMMKVKFLQEPRLSAGCQIHPSAVRSKEDVGVKKPTSTKTRQTLRRLQKTPRNF